MQCSIRKHGGKQKVYFVHRFVWECFNDLIPKGKRIYHINDNNEDNRLSNLQIMTQEQNCEKSISKRDYTFVAKNNENRKCVKAINTITKEVSYFYSMYAVQHLQINAGIVKMVCEGLNNCKSGISKKDGNPYKFEYIKQEDLPDNYKKSSNKRKRKRKLSDEDKKSSNKRKIILSDEDKKKHKKELMKKWLKKEYICPKCGNTYKNNYKYIHSKLCKKVSNP